MIEEQNNPASSRGHDERICWEIVETVNSIILRWNTDLKVTFINRYAQEFFGYTCDEILGKSVIGTIVPATSTTGKDLDALIIDIVRHPDRYVNNVNENVRHDGTRAWISWTNRAIKDRHGNVSEIISVGNDITDLKLAEDAVERHLKMTEKLLDTIPIPVFYKNAAGVYTGCNQAFAALIGKPKDRIIGRTAYEVAPPDLAGVYHKADTELISHPGKKSYETSVVASDGTRHDVIFNKATYLNDDGTAGGIIGTILDITERKNMERELIKAREDLERRVLDRTKELERANEFLRQEATEHRRDEEALRESEEEFRVLVEFSPAAIFFHQGANFIYVNAAAVRLTGYSKEQLMSMKFWEIVAPEYREMVRERGMARLKGEKPELRYEVRLATGDGVDRWIELSATLMEFRGKTSILTTALDVTQRRQAEEAMKKARSRAELYLDLMGHDISNMNQAMMGYLEMAQETLDLEGHEELIERPLEIIRHSSRLIASVKKLELAQSGKYPMKAVDLGPVIKEVTDEYSDVPGRDVKIIAAPAEGCYVTANDLLKDVLGHLVENAIRHSEGPLEIEITVDPVARDGRNYYMVSVADNGPGIPDDLKKRVFRFIDVATGSPGRRGLGLFMVRTLVESYHGKVWVEDRIPGDYHKGSRFVVLLPTTSQAAR